MKAVLVSPLLISTKDEDESCVHPPLGPLILATIARQAGHDVTVCDLNVARARGDLSASDDEHQAAADYILALEPDLVGFGTLCSTFAATILIAKALKARRPSQPVVFGGPQATIVCDELLRDIPEVDFVLAGEADYAFTQFLDELSGHQPMATPGLAHRSNGSVIRESPGPIVDLEGLPMIDYALWPLREAVDQGWYKNPVPVDAGRGCPYRCSFCSTSKHFRRRYRLKSPGRICREITALHDEYGFSSFNLYHDSLTADRACALAVANAIGECAIPELEWGCSARVDTVDPELLAIMKQNGCNRLFFGVESASARMQAAIHKGLDVEQIEPTLACARDLGFGLTISCIVGFPQEEWEDVEATLRLLLRWSGVAEVRTQVHLLAPQSGTAIFEEYGHRLQFDDWFPDRFYFNSTCPDSELAFARAHPGLCPQCHFIPNDRVDRRTLTDLRELMDLLMVILPGVGPFIVQTEPSVVDLIARWGARIRDRGLGPPSETGFFFAFLSEDNVPYGRALLEALREHPRLTAAQDSVLQLWEAMASLVEAPRVSLAGDAPPADADPMSTRSADEILPAVTRRAAIAVLSHRVHESLDEWRRHGRWRWPDRGDVRLLLVADEAEGADVQMHKVSPLIAALVELCDGRHTIADLYHFVRQFAGDEAARLRQSMGTGELLGRALGTLRQTVGLRLTVADPSTA